MTDLVARLRAVAGDLRALTTADLLYRHDHSAFLLVILLLGIAVVTIAARSTLRRRAVTLSVTLPAVLPPHRRSAAEFFRHLPMLLLLAGVPPFLIAVADPYTAVAEQQVSYPGRRIALLIDASSSMLKPFAPGRLNARAPNQATFFTSIGAADAFIRQRQSGKYRDLIALIEYGDEAYVITPFTTDYDNILLSTSLIGDWSEFMRFPSQGTKIAAAIEETTRLFETFDFADAAGNLMVVFSDGEDTQATLHGRSLREILADAVKAGIPVYLIRTNRDKKLGDLVPDALWKAAAEGTGGRFYAAGDERDVLRAIADIDQRSPGTIEMRQYGVSVRRFEPFAALAVALWLAALGLKLVFPQFTKFP